MLEERGAEIVESYDTPDWSPDKAQQEMEQSITALGKDGFDAVYVANDGMASGAIAALKSSNIPPESKFVTGQDAELAGIQRILAGDQLMTVYQPIIQIAETAAELAVPIAQEKAFLADLAGEQVDNGLGKIPSALLDTIAIETDNIESTVVKDGFLDTGEICTGPGARGGRPAVGPAALAVDAGQTDPGRARRRRARPAGRDRPRRHADGGRRRPGRGRGSAVGCGRRARPPRPRRRPPAWGCPASRPPPRRSCGAGEVLRAELALEHSDDRERRRDLAARRSRRA